ncbi:hypothetical protein PC128_g15775 [Phytophthora cactorum]|nr:hypothetical protein PC128_g15775 [Phytophthora cactorum]
MTPKMQQEITPTFTENELLELLALLDDAIWTRGNECVGPLENARLRDLVREQVTAFTTLQRSLEKIPALNQNDVFPAVNERATDPRECKELYQDLSRNLSKLYSTGVDTMRNRWPSPSLDGNKKLRENQKECLEILPGTSGRENFELTIQIQQRCAGWTTSWTPCKWDVHQGKSKVRLRARRGRPSQRDYLQKMRSSQSDHPNSEGSIGTIFDTMLASLKTTRRRKIMQNAPLFSDAELLDVLTGIDAGLRGLHGVARVGR